MGARGERRIAAATFWRTMNESTGKGIAAPRVPAAARPSGCRRLGLLPASEGGHGADLVRTAPYTVNRGRNRAKRPRLNAPRDRSEEQDEQPDHALISRHTH